MNKLNEEIKRISDLMGVKQKVLTEQLKSSNMVKTLLTEQPIPVNFVRRLLNIGDSSVDDVMDYMSEYFTFTQREADDLSRRLSSGTPIPDKYINDIAARFKYADDTGELVNLLRRAKLLGPIEMLESKIYNKAKDMAKITAEQKQQLVDIYKNSVEQLPYLKDLPDIQRQLVDDFDNGFTRQFEDKLFLVIEDLSKEVDEVGKVIDEFAINTQNAKELKEGLNRVFKERGKKLSKFFTKRDIDDYVEQAYQILENQFGKKFDDLLRSTSAKNGWDKLTPADKNKIMTQAIEQITTELPWGPNLKTWMRRIWEGSDGKWSWSVVIDRVKKVWFSSIIIQIFKELLSVTQRYANVKNGQDIKYEDRWSFILNNRSIGDFILTLILPPISWLSSLISYLTIDPDYEAVKEMTPALLKDNLFLLDEKEARDSKYRIYIRKNNVIYPITKKNNTYVIHVRPQGGGDYKQYELPNGFNQVK